MFALSHIYVSTQVTGRDSPLLIFGSILPDISWSSDSLIGRDKIHYSPKEFYEFVKEKYPSALDLALGVRLHSHIEKGADFYSDDEKQGFAKIEAKRIDLLVSKLLNEPSSERTIILGHNFIEAAVDLNLQEWKPELLDLFKDRMAQLNIQLVIDCLTSYLQLNKDLVTKEVTSYINLISINNLTSIESIAKFIAKPLIEKRFNKNVNEQDVIRILTQAKDVVKESYVGYLDNAVTQMKKDFSSVINQ